MHYERNRRNGDPLMVRPRSGGGLRAEKHPQWTGDRVGYFGVHDRLKAQRGSASEYRCRCGEPAAHWSYDHADPDGKTQVVGGSLLHYSTDLSHYSPLCVSCHSRTDQRREKRVASKSIRV